MADFERSEHLYEEVSEILGDFYKELRRKTLAPTIHIYKAHRLYGCKVEIIFFAFDYCKCSEEGCLEGRYPIQDTIFRCKSGRDVQKLKNFLQSQFNIWQEGTQHPIGEDSDTDVIVDYEEQVRVGGKKYESVLW